MATRGHEGHLRTLQVVLAAVALNLGLLGTPLALAEVPETADPIVIVTNNWTSQLVLANIAGRLLSKLGYGIRYEPAHTQLQYTAMGNGS